jgi:hypothetical protein
VRYCNITGSWVVKRHKFLALVKDDDPGRVTAGESSGDADAADDGDDDDDCAAWVNLFRGLVFIKDFYVHKAVLRSKLPIKI